MFLFYFFSFAVVAQRQWPGLRELGEGFGLNGHLEINLMACRRQCDLISNADRCLVTASDRTECDGQCWSQSVTKTDMTA